MFRLIISSILFSAVTSQMFRVASDGTFTSQFRLNIELCRQILNLIHVFLIENQDSTIWEQNDSGFARLDLPDTLLDESVKNKYDISKVRLNFWSSNTEEAINEDTLHTHPRYFESYLVHGQYNHRVYAEDRGNISYPYNKFIVKRLPAKEVNAQLADVTGLARVYEATVHQNDVVGFPLKMIHKILLSYPKTLSLNIVFRNIDEEGNEDNTTFFVYRSQYGGQDVVIKRQIISHDVSSELSSEVIKLIQTHRDQDNAHHC